MQKIIACDDPELLLKLEELLANIDTEVNEEAEKYEFETRDGLSISEAQNEELERRYRKYSEEGTKTDSLENVEKRLRQKYGL
ncbi:MAG: hypothetical protein WCE57_02610 [Salegentibacter sp.]